MNIDVMLSAIQRNCDDYISANLSSILQALLTNKVVVTQPFDEFKVGSIEPQSWGVYLFYITLNTGLPTYEDLCNHWETNASDKRLHCPKANKGNFPHRSSLIANCEYSFYVGKSENLTGRIAQHIHQRTAYTTYGLKISEHDRLDNKATFAYSYYALKSSPRENLDGLRCLLVTLERRLRQHFKPLIGKQ